MMIDGCPIPSHTTYFQHNPHVANEWQTSATPARQTRATLSATANASPSSPSTSEGCCHVVDQHCVIRQTALGILVAQFQSPDPTSRSPNHSTSNIKVGRQPQLIFLSHLILYSRFPVSRPTEDCAALISSCLTSLRIRDFLSHFPNRTVMK